MKFQRIQIVAFLMATASTLLFQNCGGNYNPSQYQQAGAASTSLTIPPAVTPTPTPTAPIAAPIISSDPQSVSVLVGQPIDLSVTVTGTDLIYQWSINGTAISGANGAQYSVAAAALTDSGSYTVTIMNGGGTVTSTDAVVTVSTPHVWVAYGAFPASGSLPTQPPASYPLDPSCSYLASGTTTATAINWSVNPTTGAVQPSLLGATCTVAGSYCLNEFRMVAPQQLPSGFNPEECYIDPAVCAAYTTPIPNYQILVCQ